VSGQLSEAVEVDDGLDEALAGVEQEGVDVSYHRP